MWGTGSRLGGGGAGPGLGCRKLVFEVDAKAGTGSAPVVSRLLRFLD